MYQPGSITRVHIEGFRSLKDVTLDLGRVTVLIGANGAGKSNLLGFFKMLSIMQDHRLRRSVSVSGGASVLLHYGPKRTQDILFQLGYRQNGGVTGYHVRLGYTAGDALSFVSEKVVYNADASVTQALFGEGHQEAQLCPRNPPEGYRYGRSEDVARFLRQMSSFHFHDTSITSTLRTNARVEDNQSLHSNGRNLAAFLYRLCRSNDSGDQAAWQRINLLVRRIAPAVQALEPRLIDHTDPNRAMCQLDWLDDQGEVFGSGYLSDGSLRAIALITALAQPASTLPAFITIDEPELGLHPAAISLLASLIRSVSVHTQIILATQSPVLLDHFSPEDVVVVERTNGESTFKRLDLVELQDWLDDYSLSELYDKNLLGGRP